ncbi:MAG: putative bifunctional diguanylate cyclase/phosphodiesterase, partial [Oceanococcus sp.]
MAKGVSADIRSANARASGAILRITSFIENSDQFSHSDFLDYIHPVLHEHPELAALSWVPRVPVAEQERFLKQIRSLDFPEFDINQLESNGRIYADLFPITYIAPLQSNSKALGLDLGSEPSRLDMLSRAARSGRLTASAPIQLVQGESEQAVLFTVPVYRSNAILNYGKTMDLGAVRGFVTGTIKTQDLLTHPRSWELLQGLSLRVSMLRADGGDDVLIHYPKTIAENGMFWHETINIAGAVWDFYAQPSAQFVANQRSALAWTVLLSSLGLSGLLGAFLLLVTGQMHRVEIAVEQRTHDLHREVKSRRGAERRLRHSEAQFRRLAFHDSLTGLANREYFSRRLTEAVNLAQRDGSMLAVHFFDLDHFKDINDAMGHPVGDGLLKCIASALNRSLRSTDVLARLGGDEFAILQSGILNEGQAETLAHTTLCSLIQPFHVAGYEVRTSSSVGIAVYNSANVVGKVSPEEVSVLLMEQADIALYEVKGSRRGEYLFHTPAMTERVHNSIAVGNALKNALDNNLPELYFAFQPQVDMSNGQINSYEMLIRWDSKELGNIGPAEFIPIAEARGLIIELGHFTLRNACQLLAKTQAKQPDGRPYTLAVNVSSTQFADPGFVRDVKAILEEEGVDAHNIELELTEAVLSRNIAQVADTLHELRRLGFEIAIDDFGTGYSSLLYLKKLPVGRIKVAQEFVRDMNDDPADAEIVRATIQIARAMDLDI